MAPNNPHTTAHRVGNRLGRVWLWLQHQENRFVSWLVQKGFPRKIAKIAMACINLMILGGLLYISFWVAFTILTMTLLLWAISNKKSGFGEIHFPDANDHKQSLHYHPMNYNDDPDPRFED